MKRVKPIYAHVSGERALNVLLGEHRRRTDGKGRTEKDHWCVTGSLCAEIRSRELFFGSVHGGDVPRLAELPLRWVSVLKALSAGGRVAEPSLKPLAP